MSTNDTGDNGRSREDNDLDEELEKIKTRTLSEMQRESKIQQERSNAIKALGGKAIDLTDSTFLSTVKRYPVMLVDFWAPWCGPCRMVSPIIDQLAKAYSDKVAFGRVNVDENQMTAGRFGIQSIPTLLFFENGNAVDELIGVYPRNTIESRIRAHLGNGSGSSSSSSPSAYQ